MKRILSLILVACLLLCSVACGAKTEPSDVVTTTTTTATEAVTSPTDMIVSPTDAITSPTDVVTQPTDVTTQSTAVTTQLADAITTSSGAITSSVNVVTTTTDGVESVVSTEVKTESKPTTTVIEGAIFTTTTTVSTTASAATTAAVATTTSAVTTTMVATTATVATTASAITTMATTTTMAATTAKTTESTAITTSATSTTGENRTTTTAGTAATATVRNTTVITASVSAATKKTTTQMSTTMTTTTTTAVVTTTTTAAPVKVISVLSVGNSLSFDAHTLLSRFANHEGVAMQTLSLMYSGCSLKKHYEFWQRNEAAYNPIVNGTADWTSKISLIDALTSQNWDVITIQESSTALSRDDMLSYGQLLCMIIRKYQPKAKLYIHQTWALGDGSKYHSDKTGGTMDAMWQITKPNYDAMAEGLKLPLIPSGEAMYNLQKAYDERGLGESAYRDALHVDLGWGAYMLALVWYRTITGEIPSNTFDAFGPYIEDATVRKLIYDTAMNAVEAYQ